MKITIEQIEELLTVFEKNATTTNKCVCFNPLIKKRLEEIGCTFKDDKIIFEEKSLYFAENPYMEPHVMYVLDYTKLNEVRKSFVDIGLSVYQMPDSFVKAGIAFNNLSKSLIMFHPEAYSYPIKLTWWQKIKRFFKKLIKNGKT